MLTINRFRSSPPELFLGKGVLEICRKFTGEDPRTSAWVFFCAFAAYFQNTFFKNTSGVLYFFRLILIRKLFAQSELHSKYILIILTKLSDSGFGSYICAR